MEMKMKGPILFALILLLCACNPSFNALRSGGCRPFYKSLRADWGRDSHGVYGFTSQEAYWQAENYATLIDEDCLLGLNREAIVRRFGEPSKELINRNRSTGFHLLIYCTNQNCYERAEIYPGHSFAFYFDNEDRLISISTSPVVSTGVENDE